MKVLPDLFLQSTDCVNAERTDVAIESFAGNVSRYTIKIYEQAFERHCPTGNWVPRAIRPRFARMCIWKIYLHMYMHIYASKRPIDSARWLLHFNNSHVDGLGFIYAMYFVSAVINSEYRVRYVARKSLWEFIGTRYTRH